MCETFISFLDRDWNFHQVFILFFTICVSVGEISLHFMLGNEVIGKHWDELGCKQNTLLLLSMLSCPGINITRHFLYRQHRDRV